MADPTVRGFVAGYLQEAAALLPEMPGIDLDAYCSTLLERFANPRMSDQLTRLSRRGSTKIPSYVLPSVRQALDQDRPRAHLVMTVAAWFRYLRGADYVGVDIGVEDARAAELQELAQAGGTDPLPLLHAPDLFGTLADDHRFAAELTAALEALEQGPLEAVRLLEQAPGAERSVA
jgi:mannitol-1-phosphate/altronate dehydrogenase